MKKLFIAAVFAFMCSVAHADDFLKSLEGHWTAQDSGTGEKMSFTIQKVGSKLMLLAVGERGKSVMVMRPIGKLAGNSRLPVTVEIHSQFRPDDEELLKHILTEAIALKHGHSQDEVYAAIVEVDSNAPYGEHSVLKYFGELGVVDQQNDTDAKLRMSNLTELKAELEAYKPVFKAPKTDDAVLEVDSKGRLIIGEGDGMGPVLVRDRKLDNIDIKRMANAQKIISERAKLFDKIIGEVIAEIDASITRINSDR